MKGKEKSLVIVESPTKIKTLRKFLGKSFRIESSVGHVRDLPRKQFGIDIEGGFTPQYEVLPEKREVVSHLQKAAKECDEVFLSPDPDREGEAISWHISKLLPEEKSIYRVTFHSITKGAVLEAFKHPRAICHSLVHAQQTRRLLDRIVGYKLSPLLSKRIPRKTGQSLSAGRVQSVALKIVVYREREIEAFVPTEYWKISARFSRDQDCFCAFLSIVDGKKIVRENPKEKERTIGSQKEAEAIVSALKKEKLFRVERVECKEKKRHPVPPFITSTLQQEASRHYRFSSQHTMRTAQSLYEGVDLGERGGEGLITYMRTDSTRTAPEAIDWVRKYIEEHFGSSYLPDRPNIYTKKGAQDAHEAIRPTSLSHSPESIRSYLSDDQYKLYLLIWKRFLASQMKPALYDTTSVDIVTEPSHFFFHMTGAVLTFRGFLILYEEKRDEKKEGETEQSLPSLREGELLQLLELFSEQSFTKPPPRFTEASLIKELERSGIGRPSTYSSIMSKIQAREYTEKQQLRLVPTELGKLVVDMLVKHFPTIMDINFTASMEDFLEKIAEDQMEWKEVLGQFWQEFYPTFQLAEKEAFVPKWETDLSCPKCGSMLYKIWARSQYFYGCSKHPECKYSISEAEFAFKKEDYAADFDWEQPCPICKGEMKIRHGKFGAFLGCRLYPDCRGIVSIAAKGEDSLSLKEITPCPTKNCEGKIIVKRSRFGKNFYTCSAFPQCSVVGNSIEAIREKYEGTERVAYQKKKTQKSSSSKQKRGKRTVTKGPRKISLMKLSSKLASLVGKDEMGRGEVMKGVWEYIKSHRLQDPKNGRIILPDEKLALLLGGSEPISMFQMTALISKSMQKIS